MAVYTLDALLDAIEGIMDDAASLVRSQTYDELTEGIHDYPLLQVYPEENTGTDWTGETDRVTLSGKHSVKEYTVHADIYARQRSHIAEDMKKCVDVANETEDILDNLSYPLFGLACVTSFRWSWRRVVFEYGGVKYMGARFVIVVRAGTQT
ncbi:MAG: hypothetical protein AMJ81_00030 [Phycisphaerae bacterium SM23_33]|nr:MAG: hypothetical protein AMS14_00820 [Planctomycetes bacterium DG_20]KPK86850.1 MAG: hypothetical protein AMJ81_00030 [Phycisphaerae bacterium SM23_33]